MLADSAKPVVLFFPFDLLSHYLRCLQVAKLLEDDFEIYFQRSARYQHWVEDAGFKSFDCADFDPETVMAKAARFDFSWLNENDLRRISASQRKVIRQLKPAVVIGDSSPVLSLSAEAEGVICANLLNAYMSPHYACQRKVSRTHPAAWMEKIFPAFAWKAIVSKAESAKLRKVHAPFRKLRSENGLQNKSNLLEEYEGHLTLVCDLQDLFPLRNPPERYYQLGPLFYTGAPASLSPDDEKAIAFLETKPCRMLVSMGSTGNPESVAWLADESFSDWAIVISGGLPFPQTASHIQQAAFLNHPALLKYCDVLICHGGNGTIYQGLQAGVPVLCATNHFEQEWNQQRIVEEGLGASLDGIKDAKAALALLRKWAGRKNGKRQSAFRDLLAQQADKAALINWLKKQLRLYR